MIDFIVGAFILALLLVTLAAIAVTLWEVLGLD